MHRAYPFAFRFGVAVLVLISLSVRPLFAVPSGQAVSLATGAARGFGSTIVVTSTADAGPGTLRQALLDTRSGDTITFDPAVFPPTRPMSIALTSGLPGIGQGNLTVDGSNAGVILDGSNIGTTPETLLLDDVSLRLDGGPNLIVNSDFSAGLGHWRPWPWEEGPGMTRRLNSSDSHSSPNSYAWSSVAHAGDGRTVYDTTNTSDPFALHPYYPGSTVWIAVTSGSTVELRFWYRHGPVRASLQALFQDGHVEQLSDWWFDWRANWAEAVASQALPANALSVALELGYGHSERGTSGFSLSSNGSVIQGLQIIHFPGAGIGLFGGAQNNTIGGDRSIGAGLLGQGNLISGNSSFGIGLWGEGASFNTIQGNIIGTDLSRARAWGGRRDGIHSNGANHNLVVDNLIGGYETGVYLCCVNDGSNTIRGNYIGTDARGVTGMGNRSSGISIDRSSGNVIGPANVTAHNAGPGVAVYTPDSLHNTITQNSIHDNGGMGIDLWDGGNGELAAPVIFDFDLNVGTVSGNACANCTVEVFSDSSDDGEVYEGRATADGAGAFTFNKGGSLTGAHLTATATDTYGNTSEFSAPTSGTRKSVILQEGNNLPKTRFQTKRSRELEDNRIGDVAETRHVGDWVWRTGLKWMRVIFDPYGWWQKVDWGKEEYAIDPRDERLINDLLSNDVRIMCVLDVWYPENRTVFYKTEEDIERYLNYVRFVVHHFKGRIVYYEVLNEPDLDFSAPSGLPLPYYVNLIKRTVPVIREEDPEARIVVGAIPDTRFDDCRDYMWGLLKSEVMPLVDGFSWHGMYGAAPSGDPRGVRAPGAPQMANYWEHYASLVKEIMDVASFSGFKGEYFVEEMLWRTPLEPHESEPYGFSDIAGAKYYARAIIIHLGLNVTTGLAVVHEEWRQQSYSVIQNLCTIMAGAEPASLPFEIQSEATNMKSLSFSLPNSDHLIALWTDGVALDDDPGVRATLTLPGFAGQNALGIDVLHGFEQRLITGTEGANLVIRNLLVKDYPIILRTAPTRYVFLPIVLKGYSG